MGYLRLNSTPAQRTLELSWLDREVETYLTGDSLAALTFQVLYETEIKYLLPELIYQASQDQFDEWDKIRQSLIFNGRFNSRGMMLSVQCHEAIPFSSKELWQANLEKYPDLRGIFEYSILGGLSYLLCPQWGVGIASDSTHKPVTSSLPTLLLAGDFDPVTPPAWAEHASQTLINSYFFTYPIAGHGASLVPGCPQEMMVAFLNNPSIAPQASCIEKMNR